MLLSYKQAHFVWFLLMLYNANCHWNTSNFLRFFSSETTYMACQNIHANAKKLSLYKTHIYGKYSPSQKLWAIPATTMLAQHSGGKNGISKTDPSFIVWSRLDSLLQESPKPAHCNVRSVVWKSVPMRIPDNHRDREHQRVIHSFCCQSVMQKKVT